MSLPNKSRLTRAIFAAALATTVCGPATAQDASRITEIYHIFNFETASPRADMIKALTAGLRLNVSASVHY